MFRRIAHSISFVIVLALAALAQAQTAPGRQAQSDQTSIIIGRQLVRFLAPGEPLEWRLEVANQQGEVVFDSGFVHSPTLEWPLLNQQGEAVPSGLYSYTLSVKDPASETPRHERGHIILDRPSQTERIWVTSGQGTGIGASSGEVKLTVVGGAEATLGGAEFTASTPPRAGTEERKEAPERGEPAAANIDPKGRGTTNLFVNEDLTVNGNIIFTPNLMRDITMQNNSGGLRFYGAPSLTPSPAAAAIQFWGNNSGFPGQLYLDAGATNQGALIFRTAVEGGTITERMRVTSGGNVGIGTTNPQGRLHVRGDITAAAAIFDNPPGTIRITKTAGVLSVDDLGIWNRSGGGGQPFAIADWETGTKGIFINTSNGDVKLGSSSGQFFATSGEENLRVIRGVINGLGDIIAGSGFTVTRIDTGRYAITFNTPFAGTPAITATVTSLGPGLGGNRAAMAFNVTSASATIATVRTDEVGPAYYDVPFSFIAIGPR